MIISSNDAFWYKIGEIYEVVDYRHNKREYYERVDRQIGFNTRDSSGLNTLLGDFWILKRDCENYIPQLITFRDELNKLLDDI